MEGQTNGRDFNTSLAEVIRHKMPQESFNLTNGRIKDKQGSSEGQYYCKSLETIKDRNFHLECMWEFESYVVGIMDRHQKIIFLPIGKNFSFMSAFRIALSNNCVHTYTGTGTKFGAYQCPSPTIFKYEMNIDWPIIWRTNWQIRKVVCIQRKFGSYFQRNVIIQRG